MTITNSHELQQQYQQQPMVFDLTQRILETDSEHNETVKDVELTYSKNDSTQKKLMSMINYNTSKDIGRQAVIFGIVDEETDEVPSYSDERNLVMSKPTKQEISLRKLKNENLISENEMEKILHK